MTLERLRAAFYRDDATRGVLAVLADRPLDDKQAEVYPALLPFIAEHLCETAPKEPRSLVETLRFLRSELAHEPTLASQLYAVIGERPVRHEAGALFAFIASARDRAGISILRGGSTTPNWVDAVLALHAEELLDEVLDAFADERSRDLATAAGVIGGERARAAIVEAGGGSAEIGLAFLAAPSDKEYFAALGRTPDETTARRIHTLLAGRGPKQRLTALAELAPGLADGTDTVAAERLVAILLTLGDKRPDLVETAALLLEAHAYTRKRGVRPLFQPMFLTHASAAVAAGVTEKARVALERVRAAIPAAAPFAAAAVVASPPTRKAAAKAKGKQMLEAMQDGAVLATGLRDAGIEAQLAADPDDRAAYLVYADWLQTRGDPRGTWITLHAGKGLAAREAIAAFEATHRVALLGAAAEAIERKHLEVEWFLGFVRRVTLRPYANADELRALFDAVCGAVVQELVCPDEAAIGWVVDVLLEKRPQTLARVTLGTTDEPPPELVAVLPRLARALEDPTARWQAVLARLAEYRKVGVDLEPSDLPALKVRTGLTIEADVAMLLRGLKHELQLEHPLGLTGAMPHVFTADSLDRFARTLGELWVARGQPDRLRWAFAATGPLGGDETARFLGDLLQALESRSRIPDVIAHLATIGTPLAIAELARASFDTTRDHRLRASARDALATMAEANAVGLDAIVGDAVVADHGDVGRARETQRWWLESVMVEGRSMAPSLWQRCFGGVHGRAIARTLLWAERTAETIVGLFRVDDAGQPVRRDGTPYVAKHGIGLVHPAELSDSELAGVRHAFADVPQAILQLERPVFGLFADEARTDELTRFVKRRVGFGPINETLRARGWYVAANDVDDEDGENRWMGTRAFGREYLRDRVEVMAVLNETRGSIASVEVYRDGKRMFDELHVVTLSELLWDLETAHRRAGDPPIVAPAPRAAPPPRQASTATPVVERAKSGRAKCVVCTEAIAKDSLRIGIERFVETPNFRGPATVWVHPACREGAPELAGVVLDGIE